MQKEISIASRDNPAGHPLPLIEGDEQLWLGRFEAMASDCEVLIEGLTFTRSVELIKAITQECWRIEHKYSRYVKGNLIWQINHSAGRAIEVDSETAKLLDFAALCFELSEGLFDVSSGVLRQIWRFDGGTAIPSHAQIQALLEHIGWQKITWQVPFIRVPAGMEIDLGGIGKEYAVDRAIALCQNILADQCETSFLVNFGGDLACTGPRLNGNAWQVGIESSEKNAVAVAKVALSGGAVATSGDSRRYVMDGDTRLSHILNPMTGRPVDNPPHAISVAGDTCLQAGLLATLSMLQGDQAEAFIQAQGNPYWIQT